MKTVVYGSFACAETTFTELFANTDSKPGQAVQKYNRLIMEGLSANGVEVHAVTEIPVTNKSHKNLHFKFNRKTEKGVTFNYIPIINIKILKDFFAIFTSFVMSCNISRKCKEAAYVVDVLNAPVALGVFLAAKIRKGKLTSVVTDIPEYGGSGTAYRIISNYMIANSDAFVFITEEMNKKYNLEGRPYVVIEGLVDVLETNADDVADIVNEKFVVMYSGTLAKIYGIRNLVEGFIKADIADSELHIYGDGDYRPELNEVRDKHRNIKYFGTVLSSQVVKAQREASLLVNPRPTADDYTKYSFPSKNMEYMVSGTPVLTTDLPGMPKEYKEYVYILEDYSLDGVAQKLCSIYGESLDKRLDIGRNAREFVLKEKNNVIQTKKIMQLI